MDKANVVYICNGVLFSLKKGDPFQKVIQRISLSLSVAVWVQSGHRNNTYAKQKLNTKNYCDKELL